MSLFNNSFGSYYDDPYFRHPSSYNRRASVPGRNSTDTYGAMLEQERLRKQQQQQLELERRRRELEEQELKRRRLLQQQKKLQEQQNRLRQLQQQQYQFDPVSSFARSSYPQEDDYGDTDSSQEEGFLPTVNPHYSGSKARVSPKHHGSRQSTHHSDERQPINSTSNHHYERTPDGGVKIPIKVINSSSPSSSSSSSSKTSSSSPKGYQPPQPAQPAHPASLSSLAELQEKIQKLKESRNSKDGKIEKVDRSVLEQMHDEDPLIEEIPLEQQQQQTTSSPASASSPSSSVGNPQYLWEDELENEDVEEIIVDCSPTSLLSPSAAATTEESQIVKKEKENPEDHLPMEIEELSSQDENTTIDDDSISPSTTEELMDVGTIAPAVKKDEPEATSEVKEDDYEMISEKNDSSSPDVWKKELEVLSYLGFTDLNMLIPLFKQYIGRPEESQDKKQQGLQAILRSLLTTTSFSNSSINSNFQQ
jgi:hypothetical protein